MRTNESARRPAAPARSALAEVVSLRAVVRTVGSAVLLLWQSSGATAGDSGYVGPLPYKSAADSPFDTSAFGFCLEDFEDRTFDVPGATINGSIVDPGGITDSVDGDDGTIDGSGSGGHSWFHYAGPSGIVVEFAKERTNGLPTLVGIAWTDGGIQSKVRFEAFDADGNSKGLLEGTTADSSYGGTTDEDRFYGASDPGGISKIRITNETGGIEVDHVQLDRCVRCGDASLDFRITATDALTTLATSVGLTTCLACTCDTNSSSSISAGDALGILKKSVGLDPALNCPACDF